MMHRKELSISINIIDLSEAFGEWKRLESRLGNTPSLDIWRHAFQTLIEDYQGNDFDKRYGYRVSSARTIIYATMRKLIRPVNSIPVRGTLNGQLAVIDCQPGECNGKT